MLFGVCGIKTGTAALIGLQETATVVCHYHALLVCPVVLIEMNLVVITYNNGNSGYGLERMTILLRFFGKFTWQNT